MAGMFIKNKHFSPVHKKSLKISLRPARNVCHKRHDIRHMNFSCRHYGYCGIINAASLWNCATNNKSIKQIFVGTKSVYFYKCSCWMLVDVFFVWVAWCRRGGFGPAICNFCASSILIFQQNQKWRCKTDADICQIFPLPICICMHISHGGQRGLVGFFKFCM